MTATPEKERKQPKARVAKTAKKASQAGSSGKRTRSTAKRVADVPSGAGVVAFMRDLEHPLKKEIEFVRGVVLGLNGAGAGEILETIKWNSPSFRTAESDYFATIFLRDHDAVRLILHTGAKPKPGAKGAMTLADPAGLVKWLAKDRCMVTLGTGKDLKENRAAFESILREWISQL